MLAFHPFAICAFIVFGVFAYIAIRTKPDLPGFIAAINTVGAQPTAITVLMIGCTMLVVCKTYAIDSDIAAGIIGCGINMLTNQFSKQHTDAAGNTTTDSTIPNTPDTTNSQTTTTNKVETPNVPPSPPTIPSR